MGVVWRCLRDDMFTLCNRISGLATFSACITVLMVFLGLLASMLYNSLDAVAPKYLLKFNYISNEL